MPFVQHERPIIIHLAPRSALGLEPISILGPEPASTLSPESTLILLQDNLLHQFIQTYIEIH